MSNWNYVVGDGSYEYLTQEQMEQNALILTEYLFNRGWSYIAIAGLLGNIQSEGILNPGQCEYGMGVPSGVTDTSYAGGLGLIQWTKPQGGEINPLLKYADEKGTNWYDGVLQAEYLTHANDQYNYGLWGWIRTESYPYTFDEFIVLDTTPSEASSAWLYNLERPGDPSSSEAIRASRAETWYQFIIESTYEPRLRYEGTDTLPYYTTYNPYWYGSSTRMPNCTAYAFGRWNELAQVTELNYNWPTGDGRDWYTQGIAKGFSYGDVPKLGAAISWDYSGGGHVAIVEEITYDDNGNPVSFITSNSAYNHGEGDRNPQQGFPWFYLENVSMSDLDNGFGTGTYQGFIYHPNITPSPTPPIPPTPVTRRKMPVWMYLKRWI